MPKDLEKKMNPDASKIESEKNVNEYLTIKKVKSRAETVKSDIFQTVITWHSTSQHLKHGIQIGTEC